MLSEKTSTLKGVRGMKDILPQQTPYWQHIEHACAAIAQQYGYQQIRLPIVEQTQLFKRTIGSVTDIVEKEMYTFDDRDGTSLSLRPEGTAGCVRAGIEQALLYNQIQRLWYMGPMFRHERPQKGRYRQFQQFGIEAYGLAGPQIDVEQILLSKRLWQQLGLDDQLKLQINCLGSKASRAAYRRLLVDYFSQYQDKLDQDAKKRLQLNPLRLLDSKQAALQPIIQNAPKITEHLDLESAEHFKQLTDLLDDAEIAYQINPYIVRGLDYYCLTVYEWITDALGAQGTVCAGGRYDSLVEQLGGKATPACGFAAGLERLVLLLEQQQVCDNKPDLYCVLVGERATQQGLILIEKLRTALPHLQINAGLSGGAFKKQFKRADQSGAQYAFIIGDDEIDNNTIGLKPLRDNSAQQSLTFQQCCNLLAKES